MSKPFLGAIPRRVSDAQTEGGVKCSVAAIVAAIAAGIVAGIVERPHGIWRYPWGRITIAKAEPAAAAFTNAAIDMGYRAVGKLRVARGLT